MEKLKSRPSTTGRVFEYRGYHHFQLRISDMEVPSGASETIQDDSYSVREIFEKFTVAGETFEDLQRTRDFQEGASHESLDLRQVMAMDLVDRQELLADVKLRQEKIISEFKARKLAAEEEEKRARDEQNDQDDDYEDAPKRSDRKDAKEESRRSESRKFSPKQKDPEEGS